MSFAEKGRYIGPEEIPWRALKRVASKEEIATVKGVIFTAADHRREKDVRMVTRTVERAEKANLRLTKELRRMRNVNMAQGRISTSSGVGYASNGSVKRARR